MKNIKQSIICLASLLLVTPLFTGCSGISQEDFNAVTAEKETLTAEKASLESQVVQLQNENQSVRSEITTVSANLTILQNNYDNLRKDYEQLQVSLEDLQGQLDEASAAVLTMSSVYPPVDFVSEAELILWLDENTVSEMPETTTVSEWITRARMVQADALADGYIINVDYDYASDTGVYSIYCTTVIEGTMYFWNPENDEVLRDTSLEPID